MRELTKSIFSFSWAMSLFGVQQMANLTDPAKATQAFEAVSDAAADSFEGLTKAAFQTGEQLQRQAVELTFGIFSRDAIDPSRLLRTTSDALRQSAETLGQSLREATTCVQTCAQTPANAPPGATREGAQGWGPMGGTASAAPPPPRPAPPPTPAAPPAQGWGPMPDAGGAR